MSAPLIPSLFASCRVISVALIAVVNAIIRGLAVLVPPLHGLADWLESNPVVDVVAYLIAAVVILLWVTLVNLLTMMWIERKFYSRIQDRYGIMIGLASLPFWPFNRLKRGRSHLGMGWLQNVADGLKLFQKENLTPALADSPMFHTAPVFIASSTLAVFAVLPFSSGFRFAEVPLDLLFILAAFSLAPLGILIAGWSANNKYTLLGGMRGAALLMAYEIPLLLAVIALAMYSGSLNIATIVAQQQAPLASLGPLVIPSWYIFSIPQFLGFVVLFIAVIAEMERIPFDIPEAEAELVEGWTTEYSGMRFGILFGFKWLRALAGSALVVYLYLGGWDGPVWFSPVVAGVAVPILPEEVWFLLKVYLVYLVFVWISWSVPRVRIDQILNIGWKRLIPLSLAAILLAAFLQTLGVLR